VKIAPRYDGRPLITLDGEPSAIATPLVRQRRRLADLLESLSSEQWATQSRCADWRVQDVVAHLIGTNQFWNLSITSGLAGTPTRVLADFDPKATPAAMVDATRATPPEETLAAFRASTEMLCATVEGLDDAGWTAIGESPAGHVTMSSLAHHALWDAWVHERDILQPLAITQDEEADEIAASLRYSAAISPALALQSQPELVGTLALEVEGPDTRAVVTVDGDVRVTSGAAPDNAFVLRGAAIEVLEALSVRAPWRQTIPAEHAWMLAGLTDVFETVAS